MNRGCDRDAKICQLVADHDCLPTDLQAVNLVRPSNKQLVDKECKDVCIDIDLSDRRPLSPLLYGIDLADLNHGIEGTCEFTCLLYRSAQSGAKSHPSGRRENAQVASA